MTSNANYVRHCHRHLAIFLHSMQDEPAWWLTVVGNDNNHDCLSKLLRLSYKKKSFTVYVTVQVD
jgi:hypothetical protein